MAQSQDRIADAAVEGCLEEDRMQSFQRHDGLKTVAPHQIPPIGAVADETVESLDGPVEEPSSEGVERQGGVDRRAGGQGVVERQVEDAELSVDVVGVLAEVLDRRGVGGVKRPAPAAARFEIAL